MKKYNYYLVIAVLSIFYLVLVGCSQNQNNNEDTTNNKSGEDKSYLLTSASTGGTFYPIGTAMSKIVSENAESIKLTNQASAGGAENVTLLKNEEVEFALLSGDTAEQAYEGKGDYDEPGNFSAVLGMYSEPLSIVTLEKTDVNNLTDIKGKKVAIGAPGSGSELKTRDMLDILGIDESDFDLQTISFADGVDGLKNGSTDVVMGWSGVPLPSVMDLSNTHDIKLIPLTSEEIEKVSSEYQWLKEITIPADIYKGVDYDTLGLAVKTQMVARNDVNEDDVYNVVKSIYENLDELHNAHNSAKEITLESATEDIVSLHPGAEKYFKEEGLIE